MCCDWPGPARRSQPLGAALLEAARVRGRSSRVSNPGEPEVGPSSPQASVERDISRSERRPDGASALRALSASPCRAPECRCRRWQPSRGGGVRTELRRKPLKSENADPREHSRSSATVATRGHPRPPSATLSHPQSPSVTITWPSAVTLDIVCHRLLWPLATIVHPQPSSVTLRHPRSPSTMALGHPRPPSATTRAGPKGWRFTT